MNLSWEISQKNTFWRVISLVPVIKEPVVLVVGDHVQNAHLFSTAVEYKQIFESEGGVVFFLMFLELCPKHQKGLLTADNFRASSPHALNDILKIETSIHSM
jgi:hypothetical protein